MPTSVAGSGPAPLLVVPEAVWRAARALARAARLSMLRAAAAVREDPLMLLWAGGGLLLVALAW
jgi:hypothetical protein